MKDAVTVWNFALQLEQVITEDLERQSKGSPQSLQPVLQLLINFQRQFCSLLVKAIESSGRSFPKVDASIAPDDNVWQNLLNLYADSLQTPAEQYMPLWAATASLDKSAAFYRQCASYFSDPAAKTFASSLAELKKMTYRRAEGALQVCINYTWQKLGFCPFPLH